MTTGWSNLMAAISLQGGPISIRDSHYSGLLARRGVVPLLLSLLAFLFCLQNSLFFDKAFVYWDSVLFAVMGKMWAEGAVLYRDMIDIKGPVIFLFNAIGFKLNGYRGIWWLEWGLLALALNAMHATLALLQVSLISRWATILAWLALYAAYYRGNMTEDYALSMGLIAQIFFLRLLLNNHFTWFHALIPALTFGLVVMMRVNNGALWGAWYTTLFLLWCRHKQWQDALWLLLSALLGLISVLFPLTIYFQMHGVLQNYWYYSFGIFFSGGYGPGFSLLAGCVGLARTGLLLLLPGLILVVGSRSRDEPEQAQLLWVLLAVCLVGSVFSVLANSVSGFAFDHYDLLFVPFFFLVFALKLDWLYLLGRKNNLASPMPYVCVLLFLGYLIYVRSQHLLFDWRHEQGWELDYAGKVIGGSLLASFSFVFCFWLLRRRIGAASLFTICLLVLLLSAPVTIGSQIILRVLDNGRYLGEWNRKQVELVAKETLPNEYVWVDNAILPQFYFWTDRRPASPYLFFDNVNPNYDLVARQLDDIKRNRPRFILLDNFRFNQVRRFPWQFPVSYSQFYDYVMNHYKIALPRQSFTPGLYRLKTAPEPSVVSTSFTLATGKTELLK